jgi:cytochrome c553
MLQKTIFAVLALALSIIPAQADIKKGSKAYLKQCKKCHGNGTKGASMKSQAEWEEAFADNAKVFKKWHAGTKGERYVNSKKFTKFAPHLKDFLHEYGNDSGNVPSCG